MERQKQVESNLVTDVYHSSSGSIHYTSEHGDLTPSLKDLDAGTKGPNGQPGIIEELNYFVSDVVFDTNNRGGNKIDASLKKFHVTNSEIDQLESLQAFYHDALTQGDPELIAFRKERLDTAVSETQIKLDEKWAEDNMKAPDLSSLKSTGSDTAQSFLTQMSELNTIKNANETAYSNLSVINERNDGKSGFEAKSTDKSMATSTYSGGSHTTLWNELQNTAMETEDAVKAHTGSLIAEKHVSSLDELIKQNDVLKTQN